MRDLGTREYEPVWSAMQEFTNQRDADTDDELWLVEHPPVFTQGQAGKRQPDGTRSGQIFPIGIAGDEDEASRAQVGRHQAGVSQDIWTENV